MELEEQVHELDKVSSEKDTLIEKYKIDYKEGEHLQEWNEKCYYLYLPYFQRWCLNWKSLSKS